MKKFAALLMITAAAFAYPIVLDLVGSDGYTTYPDSAFVCVIASGETLLEWTAMGTIGRSAFYEFSPPETLSSACAIVAAFWETDLCDTAAFELIFPATSSQIASRSDVALSISHGYGSWKGFPALPFLVELTEERITALISGSSSRPISVYRGDSKVCDFTVLGGSGDTVDISGSTAIFTARVGESETATIIVDTLEIVDGVAGAMRLTLSSSQTTISPRSYAADVQLTLPDGTVATVWRSRLVVLWDVTR